MTSLHALAGHWAVYSLGWTLLHFCWQGMLVALVLWAALQLLAQHSSRLRYEAACVALGLIVLLPLATFSHIAMDRYRLGQTGATVGIVDAPTLIIRAGFGDGDWLARLAAVLDPAIPWILLAWMAGSVLFLFRLSVGIGVTRKLRSLAISPVASELQVTFSILCERMQVTRPVLLMHSALVRVPTVIGWLRPVVLIPASCFLGLPATQIEAILYHELAHIRRHDYLVGMVQAVVEALLFYHPAVWWVSRQVRHERECCCDDIAVQIGGGDALSYAKALTTLAQRSLGPQLALRANGGILTSRIRRLLIAEGASSSSQFAATTVLALLIVSALTIGTTARADAKPAVAAVPPVIAPVRPVRAIPLEPIRPLAKGIARSTRRAAQPVQQAAPSPVPTLQQVPAAPIQVEPAIVAGSIVEKVQPIYPPLARASHVSGAVQLHAVISKTGDILNLQVIDGPEMLRASAIDAVRLWRYKPYLLNGDPVEIETTITVHYNFGGG